MTGNQGGVAEPEQHGGSAPRLAAGGLRGPSRYPCQQYEKRSCAAAPKGSSHLRGAEAAEIMEQTPLLRGDLPPR